MQSTVTNATMRRLVTAMPFDSSKLVCLVTAIVLTMVVGFWCGSSHHKMKSEPEHPQSRASSLTERNSEAQKSERTISRLVEKAMTHTMDDRQIWHEVRFLSEEEVEAAISEVAANGGIRSDPFGDDSLLPAMLLYRWGELDPQAANKKAKILYPEKFQAPREAVFAAWIQQGGSAAAWEATKNESGMWDCTMTVSGEVADMIVASLASLNDEDAFRAIKSINDDNCEVADSLCRLRAKKAFYSGESRSEFLAAARSHPMPYIHETAVRFLFREWMSHDKEQAKAAAISMPLTDDERVYAIGEIPYDERPNP